MAMQIVVNSDGTVNVSGVHLTIPNITVLQVIGTGASGIAFRGVNRVLQREVAVKLWWRLRAHDRRNKVKQGLLEARKASSVELPFVPRIFDGGQIGESIYIVMEYFDGITLRDWLRQLAPPFDWRSVIARHIDSMHAALIWKGLVHGDLHSGNILVHRSHQELPRYKARSRYESTITEMRQMPLEMRIIDFGTSRFSPPGFSINRHWKVYEQLIDSLLDPLEMKYIWNHRRPSAPTEIRLMQKWFEEYLGNMHLILLHAFEAPAPGSLRVKGDPVPILTLEGHQYVRKLITSGRLLASDREDNLMTTMTWTEYVKHGLIVV